jgi:hypothetical protein
VPSSLGLPCRLPRRRRHDEPSRDPVRQHLYDFVGDDQSARSPAGVFEVARQGPAGASAGGAAGATLLFFFLIFGILRLEIFEVPLSMVRIVGGIILMRIGF